MSKYWNLQMFSDGDGGASAAPAATGNEVSPATDVGGGSVGTAAEQAPAKASFDDLLKDEEYKSVYDSRVQKAVMKRMKSATAEREAMNPMFEALGRKYGIDVSDPSKIDLNALSEAVMNDDALFEQEAMERGMTVDGLRQVKAAERQMAAQRKADAQQRQEAEWGRIQTEAEQLKSIYPSFNLEAEMQNERFGMLLAGLSANGFSNALRTAYEAMHRDEIMSGAMKYAVSTTKQQISNAIQTSGTRPAENGAGVATATKFDPKTMSKEKRAEIRAAVHRGEKIYLD